MKLYKPVVFLFQAITVGLAIAFLVLVWQPQLLDNGRKVVEFVENPTPLLPAPPSGSGPVSYADAVAVAAPAVVNIRSSKTVVQQRSPLFDDPFFRRFFGKSVEPRTRQENSLGSGVIVNEKG